VSGRCETTGARFLRALAAILAGNALYFLAAWRWLPEAARHRPLAPDLGLAIDFALCLGIYTALGALLRRSRGR
jgi:hypothetical protein